MYLLSCVGLQVIRADLLLGIVVQQASRRPTAESTGRYIGSSVSAAHSVHARHWQTHPDVSNKVRIALY